MYECLAYQNTCKYSFVNENKIASVCMCIQYIHDWTTLFILNLNQHLSIISIFDNLTWHSQHLRFSHISISIKFGFNFLRWNFAVFLCLRQDPTYVCRIQAKVKCLLNVGSIVKIWKFLLPIWMYKSKCIYSFHVRPQYEFHMHKNIASSKQLK